MFGWVRTIQRTQVATIVRVAVLSLLLFSTSGAGASSDNFAINVHEYGLPNGADVVVQEAGFQWIRVIAYWRLMERTQGEIDFTALDEKIQALSTGGENILLCFMFIPHWSNGTAWNCPFWERDAHCSVAPSSPKHFYRFAYEVASRYGDTIDYYEIWNEPDYTVFWDESESMETWNTHILKPGVAAIREADPNSMIVGPATSGNVSDFSSFVDAYGSSFDVLSTHIYPSANLTYPDDIRQVASILNNQYGPYLSVAGAGREFWLTEIGFNSRGSSSYDFSERESSQAASIERLIDLAGLPENSLLNKVFYFHHKDSDPAQDGSPGMNYNPVRFWGLVDFQMQPKLSFWSVKDHLRGTSDFLRETFSLEGHGRTYGDQLGGVDVEVGTATWATNGNVVFAENSVAQTGPSGVGSIEFAFSDHPDSSEYRLEMSARVSDAGWIGGGYSSSQATPFWSGGVVWFIARKNGSADVFQDGLTESLCSGTVTSSGYQRYSLNLDLNAGEGTLTQNGTIVCSFEFDASRSFSDTVAAGFQIHGGSAPDEDPAAQDFDIDIGPRIDNFRLEVSGSSISAPTIVSEPDALIIAPAGSNDTLEIVAEGSSPLAYQWSKNGQELVDGSGIYGSSTRILYVSPVTATTSGEYLCTVSNPWGTAHSNVIRVAVVIDQSSYAPQPVQVPGRIEAEEYDVGGESVSYHDTSFGNICNPPAFRYEDVDVQAINDGGSGFGVGYVEEGEWLEYTIDLTRSRELAVDLRAQAANGLGVELHVDGTPVLEANRSATSGQWTTFHLGCIDLGQGEHVIRVKATEAYWNMNWIEFRPPFFQSDCGGLPPRDLGDEH